MSNHPLPGYVQPGAAKILAAPGLYKVAISPVLAATIGAFLKTPWRQYETLALRPAQESGAWSALGALFRAAASEVRRQHGWRRALPLYLRSLGYSAKGTLQNVTGRLGRLGTSTLEVMSPTLGGTSLATKLLGPVGPLAYSAAANTDTTLRALIPKYERLSPFRHLEKVEAQTHMPKNLMRRFFMGVTQLFRRKVDPELYRKTETLRRMVQARTGQIGTRFEDYVLARYLNLNQIRKSRRIYDVFSERAIRQLNRRYGLGLDFLMQKREAARNVLERRLSRLPGVARVKLYGVKHWREALPKGKAPNFKLAPDERVLGKLNQRALTTLWVGSKRSRKARKDLQRLYELALLERRQQRGVKGIINRVRFKMAPERLKQRLDRVRELPDEVIQQRLQRLRASRKLSLGQEPGFRVQPYAFGEPLRTVDFKTGKKLYVPYVGSTISLREIAEGQNPNNRLRRWFTLWANNPKLSPRERAFYQRRLRRYDNIQLRDIVTNKPIDFDLVGLIEGRR